MEADPRQRLAQLTPGFASTFAIFAAAELGIADLIAAGTGSVDGLAEATATNPAALHRLMRYLVSIGIFDHSGGAYGLTPVGQLLRSDADGTRRAGARMTGRFARAWSEIMHSLKTGETGFSKAYGKGLFDYLGADSGEAAIFDTLMSEVHGRESGPVSAAYDFGCFGCLIDVGGGNGSQLMEILRAYPALRGVVFDRPDVVQRARGLLEEAGLAERCRTVGGSFFEAVPEGGDGILLRHVLHDWDDDDAATILSNCRRALPAHGRVLVAEMIVPEDNEPSLAKQYDLSMLVLVGGRERTEAEYGALFDRAGLSVTNVIATASPTSLIEGRPKPVTSATA